MVRSRNLHSIYVRPFHEVAIIFIHVATLIHAILFLPFCNIPPETFTLDGIHVAASRHLNARTRREAIEITPSLPAKPYEPKNDHVTWRYFLSFLRPVWNSPAWQNR